MTGEQQLAATLAGALPALLAMWWVDRHDRARPEPVRLRRRAAIFGMLSAVPAIGLGFALSAVTPRVLFAGNTVESAAFRAFVGAALCEEVCKFIAMYLAVWKKAEFDERMDGLVYASRAGLGFALVENMLYMLGQQDAKAALITWVMRALLSVPGHLMWSGICGALAARRRFDHKGTGLAGGLFWAVLLHGLYDFALFAIAPLQAQGAGNAVVALLAVPPLLTWLCLRAYRKLAREALRADDADPSLRGRHRHVGESAAVV